MSNEAINKQAAAQAAPEASSHEEVLTITPAEPTEKPKDKPKTGSAKVVETIEGHVRRFTEIANDRLTRANEAAESAEQFADYSREVGEHIDALVVSLENDQNKIHKNMVKTSNHIRQIAEALSAGGSGGDGGDGDGTDVEALVNDLKSLRRLLYAMPAVLLIAMILGVVAGKMFG